MIPKFRGKCPDAGWIFGSLVKFDEHISFIMPEFNGASTMSYSVIFDRTAQFVDIETVGMSSDLKDKNGVEIFEGDFCIERGEEPYSDENMTLEEDWEYRGIVKFQDFAYWLQDNEGFLKWLGTDCDEIEVIGNIYENPDLLEVAE